MVYTKKCVWFRCFITVILLIMNMGIPYSFGASSEPPKLLSSYNSVEELYAALAKLPYDQRQKAILEGAKKEGKVVVYTSVEEDIIVPVFQDFEKRYPGVKVEYFRTEGETIVLKALNEVRADRWYWDSVNCGSAYGDLKTLNALAKHYRLFPPGNFADASKGLVWYGEDWIGTELMPLVIAYNTTMVKADEAPKSYKDLLDPKWKEKVSIDTAPDSLVTAMLKKWGKQRTEDWLDKFVNGNRALLRKGHTAQTKLLIAGEFPVASELYPYRVEKDSQSTGAPVTWVIPEDLCAAEVIPYATARRAPHPYAALLWAQYRISKEGQQVFVTVSGRIPINFDAESPYPRMRQFWTKLDRLTVISSPIDIKLFTEANDLVKKYIGARLREK